ncbi:MAG: putative toxin-antitoxin system toxin component, PIN family [Deltaproteobacteria bacterium]|nr:putative toxin-antitoxin system toxin component, PIN family [Deltaproteobacteria bacterium]
MRVVLDSNVTIAAFAARGLCNALFESCIGNHEIVLCEEILSEISDKLKNKIRLPDEIIHQILILLRSYSIIVIPEKAAINSLRDKKDLMVLGSAVAGGVSYIVAGDKDLLEVGKYKDIKIIDPRSFWEKLKDQLNKGNQSQSPKKARNR